MADYDSTVGVSLYDDFERLKRGLDEVLPKLRRIKETIGDISKIKINSNDFSRMAKEINKLKSLENLDNMVKMLNKTLGNMNFSNIKQLREELAKMKQEYNNYISMINRQTGNKIKKSNVSNYVKNAKFNSSGLNDLRGTKNQNITSYINQMNEGLNSVDRTAQRTKKSISSMFSLGKIYWFINYSKQVFRGLGNIIQSALDFTEVENYFSRAMGNMYDKAMAFQNKLADMYGMAQGTMMQAQATYKNMIGSLGGLSDEMSYKLSETVTKMTLDFSSLYNVDFDKTVQKFQSALSKQVRPIRSVSGYDITQSVLQGTASNLGIGRTISQMNELEKRLLVILTLMQQMRNSGAMNDFARTIEQPTNQLRILQEQLQEVGRWIGSVFYGVIGSVMPYINGFVMAVKELVKTFALFVGFEIPNSSGETGTILDSYGDAMDDLNTGISNAGGNTDKAIKKAKEWKNVLMSFDVANVIPEQSSSDTGGGSVSGGTGGMSVDPKILDALNKYKYLFDDIHMKAQDIRDELLKWADIAKKSFKDNIFQPIKNSWDKYGSFIYRNFKDSFKDMRELASGIFDVVSVKWKPFFQSATNLFFSLLDTASLVSSSITGFLKNIYDNGGNYLLEGIFDLSTAFINLATAINDKFVKPTVKLLKNTLGIAFSTVIGKVLGLIGKLMTEFSKFVNWVSKSEKAVKTLGIVMTGAFTITTIGKINRLWNSFSDGTSKISKLITLFVENTKVGEKLFTSYVNGGTKFNNLKKSWSDGIGVINSLIQKFNEKVQSLNITNTALGNSENATKKLADAQEFCYKATTIFQNGLTFLANHPLVAVAVAIGTVISALALYDQATASTSERIKYCSQEIQDQYQEVLNLSKAIGDSIKKSDDQIASTEAQIVVAKKYINKLKELEGADGYVNNIESAKILVQEINKVLPNTVELTENGKIEWKKTNEEISKNIELLRKQAQQQAIQETYTQLIKTQIELGQKLNEQKRKQEELQNKYNEAVKKEEDFFKERHIHSKTLQEDILEASKNLEEHTTLMKASQKEFDKSNVEVKDFEKTLSEIIDTMGDASSSTKKLSESTKKSFDKIGDNGKKNIKSVIASLNEYSNEMNSAMDKGMRASDKEVITIQRNRDKKVLAFAQMVRDYDLTYDQIIEIAESQGTNFTLAEKGTIASIVELYKTGGIESGDNFVSKLSNGITNGTWRIGDSAKGTVLNTNEILKNVPIEYRSVVESAIAKAQKVRNDAQKNIGGININASVSAKQKELDALKNKLKGVFKIGFEAKLNNFLPGLGTIIKGTMKAFNLYAKGGFPDVGEMFIARENGIPEMVGRMGSRNAVANNSQIETGIYNAVLSAIRDSGGMVQRGQGGDLHIIIKDEEGRTKIEKIIKDYNSYIKSTGGEGGFII
ncbi:MAG: hypothetical protein ACLUVC_02115 [Longibaculum sp.]